MFMNIGAWSNLLKENSINNNKVLGNSLERLSTGLRINKASDDASGLAISDKLRTQASGIKQGIDNANSAIAMMNIADKAMSELSNILDTIKAKAIQIKHFSNFRVKSFSCNKIIFTIDNSLFVHKV